MGDSSIHSTHRLTDQNFLVIWLKSDVIDSNDNFSNILTELQQIVNKIVTFTDADKCVDFLTDINDEKVFMIIPPALSQQLIPVIHDILQLNTIFIVGNYSTDDELSVNGYQKVKGVSHSIKDICELLEEHTRKCDNDYIPIDIISPADYSKINLNELPPSFMYSYILKEILLDIDYNQNSKEDLINFWFLQYYDNESQCKKINKFDKDYCANKAIWWYTQEPFVYSILNRALRLLDVELIIKMGFFLRDLHEQIQKKHAEQLPDLVPEVVYRGQGMPNEDFEKLKKSKGGLLSFNNFLSTSTDLEVSKMYCPIDSPDPDTTAVMFKLKIDPTLKSARFTLLEDESQFTDEKELLFSMCSVFRIVEIKYKIEDKFWEVTLRSTDDDDKELSQLTNYIQKEIQGGTGWHRLGYLLLKIGKFDKAEEIYQMLLDRSLQDNDLVSLGFLYSQLGLIKHYKEEYNEALKFYDKKLSSGELLPVNYPDLAATYNNIASVYVSMGKCSDALPYYMQTLEIEKEHLSPNDPDLALTYNNIGKMHKENGNYKDAISYYQEALKIYQSSTVPSNHPAFINIYNNIAGG